MTPRRVLEPIFGWASCVLGIAAIVFALYGPILCPASPSRPFAVPFSPGCTSEMAAGEPNVGLIVILFGPALAAIVLGATLHGFFTMRIGLWLLIAGTAILLMSAMLVAASFGLFLAPSLAMAGFAIWVATGPRNAAAVQR